MKAHKLKLKLTSREEMEERFNAELEAMIHDTLMKETKGRGILVYSKYKVENYDRVRVEQKLKLISKWEKQGLPTRFNTEPIGSLLYQKYFGINK